jgi:hypothetical protein
MVNNSLGRGQRMAILGSTFSLIAPKVLELRPAPETSWSKEHEDADKAALARAEEKRARKAAKRRQDASVCGERNRQSPQDVRRNERRRT